MAAPLTKPLGACCFRTIPHSGTARGTWETIAGVETYVARPSSAPDAKVILHFSDAFGASAVNSQLAMDYWADAGFTVLGIEYFEGDTAGKHVGTPGWDGMAWATEKLRRAREVTPPWIDAVRARYGADVKYFAVGYCFGGSFIMDMVAQDWITAGAFAHPGFLDEDHFRNAKKPLLMSCPEDDFTFPLDLRRRAEDTLLARPAASAAPYTIQVFSGASHGFATRADPAKRTEQWAKEEAARTVVSFFDFYAQQPWTPPAPSA
ncbi:alpha/beta-hydrolase [Epithele typhae]|uniref:alpha/beta-hydrolase n=1 Tax=Epithele typhae TaxID=378194 RepID=UPI0020087D5D|nr:alpha/beta-hydrolase [Epithele typhae]KAH9914905.1 alpha/beta-hydrolase [Epithele typhae]